MICALIPGYSFSGRSERHSLVWTYCMALAMVSQYLRIASTPRRERRGFPPVFIERRVGGMKHIRTLAAVALLTLACVASASPSPPSSRLAEVIAGPQRTPAFKARDRYRHPLEGMEFFGLTPKMTVVEIWPSGGWWTEILA